jgi:hypothetical protein
MMNDKETRLIWEAYSHKRIDEIKDMQPDDWDEYLDRKHDSIPRNPVSLKNRLDRTNQRDTRPSQSMINIIHKRMISFRERTNEDPTGLQGTALDNFYHQVAARPRKSLEQWILLKSQGEKPGMEPGDEELYKIGAAITGTTSPGGVSSDYIQDDKTKQLEITAGQHNIQTIDQAKVAVRLYKAIENLIAMKAEELPQNHDYDIWLSRHVYSDGQPDPQAYINTDQSFDFHEKIVEPVMSQIKGAINKGYI